MSLTAPTHTPTPLSLTAPTSTPTPGSLAGLDQTQDLVATALEITQGIQDLQNRIPLVERRWTAVRLFARVDGGPASAANVRGALGAWRGAQFLGIVYPENDPITLLASGGDRVVLDDSLYFYVPTSWRSGTVRFKGVVYQSQPGTLDSEPDEDNNYIEATVTFEPVDPLYVRLVPEHIHQNYHGANPESTFYYFGNEETVQFVMRDLFRFLPIAELIYDPSMNFPISIPPPFGEGQDVVVNGPVFPSLHAAQGVEWDFRPYMNGSGAFGEWPKANAAMSILRQWSPSPINSWYWYGMVDDAMDTGWGGLATNKVSSGKFGTDYDSGSPWDLDNGTTVVHEIGHKILPGSDHINCDGTESTGGGLDEDFPYPEPNCSMAAIDPAGFYGFDIYWSLWPDLLSGPTVISNDPAAAEPNRGFPYMSYKSPRWADPYDYCKSLTGVGIECDKSMVYLPPGAVRLVSNDPGPTHSHAPPAPPVGARAVLAGQAAGNYALISGSISFAQDDGEIETYVPSDAAPAGPVDESGRRLIQMNAGADGLELVFLGSAGNAIATYGLANLEDTPHEDVAKPLDALHFSEWFPVPSDATSVELRKKGAILDRRSASANAPTVKLVSPNGGNASAPLEVRWQGSDADGDTLLYTVLYSADAGTNWHAVVSSITGSSVTFVELGTIGGSTRGLFKVIASDGFLSSEDVSDAAVTVPDRAPFASIVSPGEGGRFAQHATVTLGGVAFDVEEHGLPPAGLSWESDLDGDLGEGAEVMTRTLRPGTHRITLRARDGAGNVGIATTQVVIEAGNRTLPSETEERELVERLGGTIAANDDSNALWYIVGGAVAGVVAGVGGAAFWSRKKRSTAA